MTTDTLRIKRRIAPGATGGPSSLMNAEIAFNENDHTLYYGFGDNGSGTATNVIAIAGTGWGSSYVTTAIAAQAAIDASNYAPIVAANLTGAATLNGSPIATTASVSSAIAAQATTDAGLYATPTSVATAISTQASTDATTYATPASIASAIAAQATTDAGNYAPLIGANLTGAVTLDGSPIATTASVASAIATQAATDTGLYATPASVISAISAQATTDAGSYAPLVAAHLTGAATLNGSPIATTASVTSAIVAQATTDAGLYATPASVISAISAQATTDAGNYAPLVAATLTGAATLNGSPIATTASVTSAIAAQATTDAGLYATPASVTSAIATQATTDAGLYATPTSVATAIAAQATTDAGLYATPTSVATAISTQATTDAGLYATPTFVTTAISTQATADAGIYATMNYVDAAIQGLQVKPTANAAATGPLSPTNTYDNGAAGGVGATLTATANGALSVDGIVVAANDIVLVMGELAAANNGLYVVTQTGSDTAQYVLTRQIDMDVAADFSGAFVPVDAGAVNANTLWLANPGATIVVGTTSIPFTQLNAATQLTQGDGIDIAGNTISAVGTSDRISVGIDGIDIASTYVGQTSLVTLGTVTSGTWNASPISVVYGGTGATTLTGYVTGSGIGALAAVTSIPNTDITGLGDMSTQFSNAVAITGGTIDGVTLDFGTF